MSANLSVLKRTRDPPPLRENDTTTTRKRSVDRYLPALTAWLQQFPGCGSAACAPVSKLENFGWFGHEAGKRPKRQDKAGVKKRGTQTRPRQQRTQAPADRRPPTAASTAAGGPTSRGMRRSFAAPRLTCVFSPPLSAPFVHSRIQSCTSVVPHLLVGSQHHSTPAVLCHCRLTGSFGRGHPACLRPQYFWCVFSQQ